MTDRNGKHDKRLVQSSGNIDLNEIYVYFLYPTCIIRWEFARWCLNVGKISPLPPYINYAYIMILTRAVFMIALCLHVYEKYESSWLHG